MKSENQENSEFMLIYKEIDKLTNDIETSLFSFNKDKYIVGDFSEGDNPFAFKKEIPDKDKILLERIIPYAIEISDSINKIRQELSSYLMADHSFYK